MKLKRLLSLLLCVMLLSAFIVPLNAYAAEYSMENFNPHSYSYIRGQYADVDECAWYGLEGQGVVSTACGLGLMNGTGNGFSPDGSLTIAQVVTMAARLCSIYVGDNHVFTQGNPWYQCYVDYAEEWGILSDGEFAGEMDRTATRAEMAYIFFYALPLDELKVINTIDSLPDVDKSNPYWMEIYSLYEIGILTGNDAYGTFTPNAPINRASAAAIVSRFALPELRKAFTLQPSPVASAPANPAALLDYSHYNVSRPSSINSYDDFVYAWEWMLVNDVFDEKFSSDLVVTQSDIDNLQDAAIEAFNLVATMEYFEYTSFRRSVSIRTYYSYNQYGQCFNLNFELGLHNVDGISDSAIRTQVTQFEQACANIVTNLYKTGELKTSMSNREKAYVLYRYVVLHNKYDESYRYYTAYDAAVRGTSVCQGYAGMYSYLCNLAGVPAQGMTGMAGGGSHAWNRIYDNGKWYYVDTTFADPVPDMPGQCDDSWFWLTESQIRGGSDPHTLDTDKIIYAGTFGLGAEQAA